MVSGGGGTALCSHFSGVCVGETTARRTAALFYAVEITVDADGAIQGRVLQAFDPVAGRAGIAFGA